MNDGRELPDPVKHKRLYDVKGMGSSRFAILALGFALARGASIGAAEADHSFDGAWDTVVSCGNTAGAQGYSFRFPSVVKDAVLHGEKGAKGKPGWLQLDGKIQAGGSARIYADGLVGAADAAIGHRPAGTRYGYHIEAKFSQESGSGKRVEGRACTVTFEKMRKAD